LPFFTAAKRGFPHFNVITGSDLGVSSGGLFNGFNVYEACKRTGIPKANIMMDQIQRNGMVFLSKVASMD